jgi:dihydroflavonol-4-reductase
VKTAFVTGGTGFLGINLVDELTKQGWSLTCLHRANSDLKYLRRYPVQLQVGDLLEPDSLERAVPQGVDAVFHVAADTSSWWKHDAAQTATNVGGTRNLLNAARKRGAKRFVLTSTAAAFGRQTGALSEQIPSTGGSSWINYERSKWLSEEEVRGATRQGLPGVIINPCAVLGPYDVSIWGSAFQLIRDGKLKILPPGTVPINHVTEVARAHIAAAERGAAGDNYLLGGEIVPIARIFREMANLIGAELRAPVMPPIVFKGIARIAAVVSAFTGKEPDMSREMADILCRRNTLATDKAERELAYKPRQLHQCLQDSYSWLKSEGLL